MGFVPDGFEPDPPASGGFADSAVNFLKNFGHAVDPRPALKLLYDAAGAYSSLSSGDPSRTQPLVNDLKQLGGAQLEQFHKAKKAYDEGRVSEAVGHTIAGALPLVGPAAANAGEQIGSGDISGGAGAATGLLAGLAAPKVAAMIPKRVSLPAPTAVLEDVVGFGKQAGIPIDAATATGSKVVQSMQKKAGDTPAGAIIAERFKRAQSDALRATGEDLAGQANQAPMQGPLASGQARPVVPGPAVTPEQVGTLAQNRVADVVRDKHGEASAAYGQLREIADQNVATVSTRSPKVVDPDAPPTFTNKPNALADEVFESAYADARKNGYDGSKGDLRRRFNAEVDRGFRGIEDSDGGKAELGPETLLADIRRYGGLKPFDKEGMTGSVAVKYRGEYESLQAGFNAHTSGWSQRGGAQIFRNNGLTLDGMLEALRQDPKWAGKFESTNDLLNELNDISREGPTPKTGRATVQDALRLTDARPGAQWWVEHAEKDLALPVDLAGTRPAFTPLYERLARKKELTGSLQGAEARAMVALDSLMRGPDAAGIETVDAALSDLKALARGSGDTLPELRSSGQGIAAQAVSALDKAVREAAERGGPDAVSALTRGRAATRAKYAAGEVLKGLEGSNSEPVGTYRRLTARGDSAIGQLRELAREAPEVLPHVGRAVLDGLLEKATGDGGFDHARAIRSQWEKLGPQTRVMLFREPGYIKNLDRFFQLADKIAENPNPSGTARIANLYDLASNAVGYPLAKLLYSDKGVKLLTQGLRIPLQSPTMVASYSSRLAAALRAAKLADPAMADERREQTPTTIGRR